MTYSNQLLVFGGVESQSTLGKTSRSSVEKQQTQPTHSADTGSRTSATLVEGECAYHNASPSVHNNRRNNHLDFSIKKALLEILSQVLYTIGVNCNWICKWEITKNRLRYCGVNKPRSVQSSPPLSSKFPTGYVSPLKEYRVYMYICFGLFTTFPVIKSSYETTHSRKGATRSCCNKTFQISRTSKETLGYAFHCHRSCTKQASDMYKRWLSFCGPLDLRLFICSLVQGFTNMWSASFALLYVICTICMSDLAWELYCKLHVL